MEKIYGYKEKDIIGLAKFILDRKNEPLSEIFEKYAVINGKAKGSIRNLYYALAKRSSSDKEFCDKYLNGNPIYARKIVEFSFEEEKDLIKQILLARQKGKSVRSTIMELSNGDGKIALRYQNKYRNALKNKPQLIFEIIEELKENGNKIDHEIVENNCKYFIPDQQFNRLKGEIDNLVSKISIKIRRENQYLKERICTLENENLKLLTLLYGNPKPIDTKKYFNHVKRKEFIN